MSLGGNFGKPLFGTQTSSAASFGNAASPFGGPSPFGSSQSAPSFGSNPNAFQGGSVFGGGAPSSVTPQAGFGAPPSVAGPTPAAPSPFGQAQPAFGNTGIGTTQVQPTFGQSSPSFFGSGSTFGSSQAAFASSAPFLASTFNQPSFAGGATSLGGFGSVGLGTQTAQSAPTFGSSTAAFGAKNVQTGIGFSTSAFGNTPSNVAPSFGQGSVQGNTLKGTGNPKFQPVQEYDGGGVNVKYMSISRMPDYQDKSFEELRYEDYLLGKKNSSSLSTFQPTGNAFGAPSINTGIGAPSSGFFASTPALSTPGFGASSSSLFGNTSSAAFGASQPSSVPGIGFGSSPFGQTSTGFGSNTSVFGGSSSVPAFSSQSGASFQAATPFGFSSSSSSLFSTSAGQKPFSGFGSSMPNQPVGSFGSTSFFGNTSSAPSFGGSFGNTSAPSQPTLNLGSFGSSFGGNRFSPTTTSSSASFGTSTFASSSPFANSFAFGADSSKPSSSLFGGGLSTSPQTTSTLFGSSPAVSSGTSLFGSFSSNPMSNILSPIGQPPNAGVSSGPSMGFSGIGNSFSGLQNSSSGLFGSTANFSFSAPAQQSSSFFMGNAPLLGTQNTNMMNSNTQGQQNWQFPTSQNIVSNEMSTPYGRSPIFEAASLSFGRSSSSNKPLESPVSSSAISFSTGKTIARPSARSVARIHARSLRSSLAFNSPLFETKKTVSVFSPEHFVLVETKSESPSSAMKSPMIGKSDMKRLIITPRSDEKLDNSHEERRNDVGEWSSPAEKKLSFASSPPPPFLSSSEKHEKSNGIVSSTEKRKSGELQEQSSVAKPTPLRSPGQYSGNLKSPSVYSSYREFYEDNLSPEASTKSSSQVEESNAAPILTKLNYFTLPSMEKLRKMRDEDLSHVEKFTVGRRNVGEIQWFGETDVRNLNLDRLVVIENREVIVYPDEEEKPEIGVGLNKPAKVSLHNVWKLDKKTGQPLKDVANVTKFTAKLKLHCEKQGLTFLGYDVTQGTWSFEVPHFSRYGLPDSSEDELSDEERDIIEGDPSNRPASLHRIFDKEIERIHEDEAEDEFTSIEQMYIKDSSKEANMGISNEKLTDENIFSGTREGKKLTSRILFTSKKQPKLSVFSSELGKTPERHFFPTISSKMEWRNKLIEEPVDSQIAIEKSPSPMRTSSEQVSDRIDEESCKDEFLESQESIPETAVFSPIFSQSLLQLCSRVTLKNSFLYRETEMKGSPLLFLGRSFRASIGPGFRITFPIFSNSSSSSPILIHRQTQDWEQPFIQKTLQIHFSTWKLSLDKMEESVEYTYRPSFRLPFMHHEVVVKTLEQLISEAGFSGNQHFELVLRLLLCMFVYKFDNVDVTTNDNELLFFRRNLSDWLQKYAFTFDQEERNPGNDQFLSIFELLCKGEIVQAVQFCSESRNFRLACMIAKAMQLQDGDYRSGCSKIHRFYCGNVAKDLDRIYSLLSGDILHATEDYCLSWYRTFGLHFWYGSGALSADSDGLKHALQSYIEQWQNNTNTVALPISPHIAVSVPEHEQFEASRGLKSSSLLYDACYVLLCIAADLYPEHVQWMHLATPLAYGTQRDPLDSHKPWLVCEILSSISATSYLDPKVIISFAVQLEMMHLHTWAFYILWSCDIFGSNHMSCLKNVFIQWFPWLVSEMVDGSEEILPSDEFLRELGVPDSWFEEATSVYSRYKFEFLEEAEHLCSLLNMETDDYSLFDSSVQIANRTHQIVLSRAAPTVCLLENDRIHWTKLNDILNKLDAIERADPGIIRNYHHGGSILREILSAVIQGRSLSIESLESLFHRLEPFLSVLTSLSKRRDVNVDLFITCLFSFIFRETWKQLLEEMDDAKLRRLVSCLMTLQHVPNVPWSCKHFIRSFMETYHSHGILFARDSPTRLYSSLFDLWFPRQLVE